MGREIKRVPLDFDWPLGKRWEGFLNPHSSALEECDVCHCRGTSPAYQELVNLWHYGNRMGLPIGDWKNKARRVNLTQEEVNYLVDQGGLYDLAWEWVKGEGRKPVLNPNGSRYYPDAAEVSAAAHKSFFILMGSDEYIMCRHWLDEAGEPLLCAACAGEGRFFRTRKAQKLYDSWEETPIPEGDGWQVWETVSEGSPVSPVFATPEELIEYLVEGDWADRKYGKTPPSRSAVEAFVLGSGWVPSGVTIVQPDGTAEFYSGIRAADK